MKKIIFFIMTFICFNGFSLGDEWLEWEGFESPYGATYWNNCIYISNLGEKNTKSNTPGYISKIKRDGVISSEYWVEDLTAPKGMTVLNLVLYVADKDTIKGFSILDAKNTFELKIDGATDLTGITVLDVNSLIVSDTKSGLLYKVIITDKVAHQFIDDKIEGITGLFKDGSRLFFATMGNGKKDSGRIGFIKIRLKFDRETTMLKPFYISNLSGNFYGIATKGNDVYFTDFGNDGFGRLGKYEINDNELTWFDIKDIETPLLFWQRVDDFYIPLNKNGKLLTIIDVH